MTNRENINTMSNEELAELLVTTTEVDETDYDCDEYSLPYINFVTQYGNAMIGWYYAYDDAILETIKWLESEYITQNDKCSTCVHRDDNYLDGDCYACLKGIRDGHEEDDV